MFPRLFLILFFAFALTNVFALKKFTWEKDLRSEWMIFKDGTYKTAGDIGFSGLTTVYFRVNARLQPDCMLRFASDTPYFIFVNGKIVGEYDGQALLSVDSLAGVVNSGQLLVAVHQERINERDLQTELISTHPSPPATEDHARKPYSYMRDFVVGDYSDWDSPKARRGLAEWSAAVWPVWDPLRGGPKTRLKRLADRGRPDSRWG